MKKVAIFTSSRSDFSLLRRLIELCSYVFDADLLIAGAHTGIQQQNDAGIWHHIRHLTIKQVAIPFTMEKLSHQAQCLAIAQVQQNLSLHLAEQSYDLMLLPGESWELFGASVPAFLFNIPIAHISGGEISVGNDSVSHAHTKLASLHFAANQTCARNISTMGEEDWRITVSGECGIDAIHQTGIASRDDIARQYGIDLSLPLILVSCHPSPREFNLPVHAQIECIVKALDQWQGHTIVFTAVDPEPGAEQIVARIKKYVAAGGPRHFIPGLSIKNYLTILQHAKVVLGNSSSGLVEAASFGVPCVNVGHRQQGRMAARSVLHAAYSEQDIGRQLDKALSAEFQLSSRDCANPYDPYRDGRNSDRIVYALQRALDSIPSEKLLQKKLDFAVHDEQWNQLLKGYK